MERLAAALALLACSAPAQSPIPVDDRLQLFVDRALVESMERADLRLHAPVPAGTAFALDQPWEGGLSGYFTVLHDGERYRIYYRGRPVGTAGDGAAAAREVTCVAFSDDGLRWQKPELGLVEVDGSTANNVILGGPGPVTHNFAPFVDARPGVPAAERFKALAGTVRSDGLLAFVSADGLRWQQVGESPVITAGAFDSQNVGFWSDRDACYVCYLRVFVDGVRWVARATSPDFEHWSEPVPIVTPGAPREHLYTNQAQPYFRAPHVELATAARFWPGRRALTEDQIAAIGLRDAGRYPGLEGGTSDVVLMTSRVPGVFDRTFLESWIRPGLDPRSFVARANYPAHGIVPTGAHEISVYVQRDYGQPSARLERLALRTDGFVSVHAGYGGGEMVTRPLVFGPLERAAPRDGPVRFGGSGLEIDQPVAIRLPGTRALGDAWTLAVWVRGVPPGHRRLLSAYDGGSTRPGELVFDCDASGAPLGDDGPLRLLVDDVRVVAPRGSIADWSGPRDAPQVLAATWDHGEVALFAGGVEVARAGAAGHAPITLRLGDLLLAEDYPPTSRTNEPLLGVVRRVAVLRRALTAAEVAALPASATGGQVWEMDRSGDLVIPSPPSRALRRLELNVSTSAAGEVRVELQDVDGAPLPGRALEDCDPIIGDELDRVVTWGGDAELQAHEGRPIRVRFALKDADLYALRFR